MSTTERGKGGSGFKSDQSKYENVVLIQEKVHNVEIANLQVLTKAAHPNPRPSAAVQHHSAAFHQTRRIYLPTYQTQDAEFPK